MQLHVKGKNLEVSDSMRSYVERKLQKLDRRVHELTRVEIELTEERRGRAHGMECGAEVVDESGKGQLRRTAAPADSVIRFVHRDGVTMACELDRCGEPIGPGANYDGIAHSVRSRERADRSSPRRGLR